MDDSISSELYLFMPPDLEHMIGCAYINMYEHKIGMTEFSDNMQLSNLENIILQLNTINNDYAFSCYTNFPNSSIKNILVQLFQKVSAKYNELELPTKANQIVNKSDVGLLIDKSIDYCSELNMAQASVALSMGMRRLNLSGDPTMHKQFTIYEIKVNSFLKLDTAAFASLNVFPQNSISANSKKITSIDSLFTLLNKMLNKMGRRCLQRWLKQPLTCKKEIEKRLDIVESFINNGVVGSNLKKVMAKMPDAQVIVLKLYKVSIGKNANITLEDCIKVKELIAEAKNIMEILLGSSSFSSYTDKLSMLFGVLDKLLDMLDKSIVLNSDKEYIVAPSYDEALTSRMSEMNSIYDDIVSLKSQIEMQFRCDRETVKISDTKSEVFVFQIHKKFHEEVAGNDKYIITNTQKTTLSFTCPELRQLAKQYQSTKEKYTKEQAELCYKIYGVASSYHTPLANLCTLISELDVLSGFAIVAQNAPKQYSRPIMVEGGDILIKSGRHPLLESNFDVNVIDNDCTLKRESSRLHVITGPNMGGKSTYIKQVGIIAYLAHVGSFVPAQYAQIPILDAIIARVGASDHQLKGISTFMEEMLEASCMLRIATSNSLLLVDELGRGTSTSDGFGIAMSIAEYICKEVKAFCLFATHFHEIADLCSHCDGSKNYFMSATISNKELRMDYKLKEGSVDESYGINVAELLMMPKQIIDRAWEIEKDYKLNE